MFIQTRQILLAPFDAPRNMASEVEVVPYALNPEDVTFMRADEMDSTVTVCMVRGYGEVHLDEPMESLMEKLEASQSLWRAN